MDKVVELVGGGSVIIRAYPVPSLVFRIYAQTNTHYWTAPEDILYRQSKLASCNCQDLENCLYLVYPFNTSLPLQLLE